MYSALPLHSRRSSTPARYVSLPHAPDDENLPPYPLRLAVAKLLIEVSLRKPAIAILERLLLEDDTVPEVWFLVSACYRDTRRPATAKQYLTALLEVRWCCVRRLYVSAAHGTHHHTAAHTPCCTK